MLKIFTLFVVVVLAASQGPGQAQSTGLARLRLTVLDPSGAVIAGARVRVWNDKDLEQSLITDAKGEIFLSQLAPGRYRIHVEAKGFEPRGLDEVTLHAGENPIGVRLAIAPIHEQTEVTVDKQEALSDPRGNAFTTVLTPEQIAQLPDDPDEFEAALRQMAGPGAILRVNGFTGGRLPPKSQIREIRFRQNPYAAENHKAGHVSVDILTKPGLNTWHGTLNLGFRNQALTARNAFAPRRGAEENGRFALALDGPVWRDHTSLSLSADGTRAYDTKTIVAALPGRRVEMGLQLSL